jgi:hypothetical protein
VYLKLAFFYEDLASKDWPEAGEHSHKCYRYYLDNVDNEDTAVLTRLGNLFIKEHKPDAVIAFFENENKRYSLILLV